VVPLEGEVHERASAACRSLRSTMLGIRDGADVVATASAFRLGVSGLETDLADLLEDPDGARTLLLFVFGHTQATQMQRMASAVGAIVADEDLENSFERGLRIVLAGLTAVRS